MVEAERDVIDENQDIKDNKDKTESRRLVNELVNNFLDYEPIPGITAELKAHTVLYEGIDLTDVNGLITKFIHDDNRVVVFTGPDGEGIPSISEAELDSYSFDEFLTTIF